PRGQSRPERGKARSRRRGKTRTEHGATAREFGQGRCLLEVPGQQLRSQAVHQEEGCSAGRAHTELVVVSGYPEGRGQRGGDRGQGVRPVRGYTDLLVRGA